MSSRKTKRVNDYINTIQAYTSPHSAWQFKVVFNSQLHALLIRSHTSSLSYTFVVLFYVLSWFICLHYRRWKETCDRCTQERPTATWHWFLALLPVFLFFFSLPIIPLCKNKHIDLY